MLKIWMNESNCKNENIVDYPDDWYFDYSDESILDLPLAKEIIADTSAVVKFNTDGSYLTKFGYRINDTKFSEGCKCLLMMLSKENIEFDLTFYLSSMGENCEKYMEAIADMHDVNIILTRPYIPYVRNTLPKSGVKVMDTGDIVYTVEEYHKLYTQYYNPFRG